VRPTQHCQDNTLAEGGQVSLREWCRGSIHVEFLGDAKGVGQYKEPTIKPARGGSMETRVRESALVDRESSGTPKVACSTDYLCIPIHPFDCLGRSRSSAFDQLASSFP